MPKDLKDLVDLWRNEIDTIKSEPYYTTDLFAVERVNTLEEVCSQVSDILNKD